MRKDKRREEGSEIVKGKKSERAEALVAIVITFLVFKPVVSRSRRTKTGSSSCSSTGEAVNPMPFSSFLFCGDEMGLEATLAVDLMIGEGAAVPAGAGSGNRFMSPTMCSS